MGVIAADPLELDVNNEGNSAGTVEIECPPQWRAVGYTGAALETGGIIFFDVGARAA